MAGSEPHAFIIGKHICLNQDLPNLTQFYHLHQVGTHLAYTYIYSVVYTFRLVIKVSNHFVASILQLAGTSTIPNIFQLYEYKTASGNASIISRKQLALSLSLLRGLKSLTLMVCITVIFSRITYIRLSIGTLQHFFNLFYL